jgi:prepilin-type N-terminal cleavage/methylation domain-containing protein
MATERHNQYSKRSLTFTGITRAVNGFTLTEVLITIAIVGLLGSLALPNYLKQLQKTRQSEAVAVISQLKNAIVGYVDENGIHPNSWKELNETTAIMTPTGPASQEDLNWLTVASSGCGESNNNCYKIKITRDSNYYVLEAKTTQENSANYNAFACVDLKTGASDLRKGTTSKAASKEDLNCKAGTE